MYRAMHSRGSQQMLSDIRNSINKALESTFPEWTWCETHRRIVSHNSIVHMGEDSLHKCSTCPASTLTKDARSVYPVLQRLPGSLQDLLAMREEWSEVHEEMIKTLGKVQNDIHSVTEGAMASSSSLADQELRLWQVYSIAAFDVVRQHLIHTVFIPRVQMLAEGKERNEVLALIRKETPTAASYLDFLVDWTSDAVTHNGGSNDGNQLFCFEHNKLGDLLPIKGFDAYVSTCWICPIHQSSHAGSRLRIEEARFVSKFVDASDIQHVKRL